ncbi:hypothetical protein [Fibrobacter sp.]|uniref:hypothetical protein n=1 Tax=Fibrobacter sp. TaxID=35828 RepID=UPI00388F2B1B
MKCDGLQNVEIVFGRQATIQTRTKAFLEELLWRRDQGGAAGRCGNRDDLV